MAFAHCTDLQVQMDRAVRLEEERRKVEQESARLEAERQAALLAKEELARQAEDQIKNHEQLVSTVDSSNQKQSVVCRLVTTAGTLLHQKSYKWFF